MAWRDQSVGSHREFDLQGEVDQLAIGDRLYQSFKTGIMKPLTALSVTAPDDVRQQIERIREQLDALATLIDDTEPAATVATMPAVNGASVVAASVATPPTPHVDDIGRNQRSRVREMLLLETLEADQRAFSLGQLTRALETAGFSDTSAAVVSQLHRLKKLGIIDQPANGMYEITQDGLAQVRRLRRSFGAMLRR